MDFTLLAYFVAVADKMSFSIAAEDLYLSQSSLSKRIKSLEKELGVGLFSRNSHSISLTPAGEALLPYARKITNEIEVMRGKLLCTSAKVRLRLAAFSFLSCYRLDKLIADFISRHSNIDVSLMENASSCVLPMLDQDVIDAYFFYDAGGFPSKQYNSFPLLQEELVLALPPSHSLRTRADVSISELANMRIITIANRDEPFILQYLEKYGYRSSLHIEPSNVWVASLKAIMQNENCVSMLPRVVAQYHGLFYVPISNIPPFSLSLISKWDSGADAALTEFRSFLNRNIQTLHIN